MIDSPKPNMLVVLAIALMDASCSLIPLQAGRIDAVLHYHQTYDFADLRSRDPDGHRFGPRLLVAALGRKNYCILEESLRSAYQSNLMAGGENQWIVDGLATAIVSPSPWWTDGFSFEAAGRYIIRDHSTAIATADFYVAQQSVMDAKNLFLNDQRLEAEKGSLRWIDLLIHQIIIREVDLRPSPKDKRFVYESDAVLRIYIMPLNPDGVFMIAPVGHEVGIVASHEPGKVYSVGCVRFIDLENQPKIFDVRARDSILRAKDYPELLRRAGVQERSVSFSPQWYGHSCASEERQPLYRAGSKRSAEEWTPDPEGKLFEHMFDATCSTDVDPSTGARSEASR